MHRTMAVAVALIAVSWATAAAPPASVDYVRDIKPLLRERCFACHGALEQKGGLRVDTVTFLREGGNTGPAVVPGQTDEGRLLERVGEKARKRMPPEGPPLTPAQIEAVRSWIHKGANGPAGEQPEADPRSHWAFRKLVRPAVPSAPQANPIDRFVWTAWQRQQLAPAPVADRPTLIRRLYLDLLGLPPTREQLRAHLADDSPRAYERLVDQLLASPAYGERWGRHWMDVWRYSDWYGRRSVPDVLNSYGMIWRWRDWIVRSLNEDRPYDRMIQEMLAADELCPTDRDNLPATGFLVRNFFRWNYNQWMRDNIEHTGKAFLGLTLNCCQCHDHKYDPISQQDYFRFRAFFEPLELRHERVPGEPDPGVFPRYSYGAAYKPITSGMIRVFDEKPDAETFMYERGDERMRTPGKPPVPPGAPAFLGGQRLTVTPITLPAEAAHPGLQDFVQKEEEQARFRLWASKREALLAARQKREQLETSASETAGKAPESYAKLLSQLRLTRAAEAVLNAEVSAAEAEWLAIRARIAADNAKHGKSPGDASALASAAARAEKLAALAVAVVKLTQQEQNLLIYTADGNAAQLAATEKSLPGLRTAVDAARAAVAKAGTSYTPLGPSYPTRSSGRRLALARWITSPEHPLTARVAVNHLWGWHFGQPLVASTANFGRQSPPPTHPELLDWLASELQSNGWRFKALHRLIVTSEAYRLASSHPADAGNRERDPDNHYLWKFPARRLEAEVIRDSLLQVTGELDRAIGGPEIAQEQGLTVPRRSLYFAHHGETRMAFLDLFDAANPCDCYRRAASVRPQQALALANSELTLRLARRLAAKLLKATDDAEFVTMAFEQVLTRPPTEAERHASSVFLAKQVELFTKTLPIAVASTIAGDAPATEPKRRARENLIHALLNHTDFVTLR